MTKDQIMRLLTSGMGPKIIFRRTLNRLDKSLRLLLAFSSLVLIVFEVDPSFSTERGAEFALFGAGLPACGEAALVPK